MTQGNFARWLYKGKRPNGIARFMNWFSTKLFAVGVTPDYWVTMDVIGRKSGKIVSLPLVVAEVDGQRYLVSMLGEKAQWVENVKAAGYKAVLRTRTAEAVTLAEVPVERRAPIIRNYLQRAPGARPHIPVDKNAPLPEFEKIAPTLPVFHITSSTPVQ